MPIQPKTDQVFLNMLKTFENVFFKKRDLSQTHIKWWFSFFEWSETLPGVIRNISLWFWPSLCLESRHALNPVKCQFCFPGTFPNASVTLFYARIYDSMALKCLLSLPGNFLGAPFGPLAAIGGTPRRKRCPRGSKKDPKSLPRPPKVPEMFQRFSQKTQKIPKMF